MTGFCLGVFYHLVLSLHVGQLVAWWSTYVSSCSVDVDLPFGGTCAAHLITACSCTFPGQVHTAVKKLRRQLRATNVPFGCRTHATHVQYFGSGTSRGVIHPLGHSVCVASSSIVVYPAIELVGNNGWRSAALARFLLPAAPRRR